MDDDKTISTPELFRAGGSKRGSILNKLISLGDVLTTMDVLAGVNSHYSRPCQRRTGVNCVISRDSNLSTLTCRRVIIGFSPQRTNWAS